MQERIFGSRILHFEGFCEEIFFECNASTRCECSWVSGGTVLRESATQTLKARVTTALETIKEPTDSLIASTMLWKVYITICEDYTARGLTFATDMMPAVSSLMSRFAPFFGNYYAGLWEHHMLLSLQWEALDTMDCSRHKLFVAPSFSWVSRSGLSFGIRIHPKCPQKRHTVSRPLSTSLVL